MQGDQSKMIVVWVLSILLAVAYFWAGLWKLLGSEAMASQFAGWGYPVWFMTVIGIIEVGGGITLLVPRTAAYAAAALGVVMLGAAYTHIANAEGAAVLRPLLFLAVLAVVFWLRRRDVGPVVAGAAGPPAG